MDVLPDLDRSRASREHSVDCLHGVHRLVFGVEEQRGTLGKIGA